MSALIFLIGATSFIGTNLFIYLKNQKYDVVPVSKSGNPVDGASGITFTDFLKTNPTKDTIIINCAAARYDASDPFNPVDRLLDNTNIIGSIYRFCINKGISEVRQFSSSAVYPADESKFSDVNELDLNKLPHHNESMYAWSKRIGEIYANLFQCYGINTITFRPTSPYGPHDRLTTESAHVIPSLIIKALKSEDELVIDGNLDGIRDFIFVDDVCQVIGKSLWIRNKNDVYNLGSGTQTKIVELAISILDILKKPKRVISTNKLNSPVQVRKCDNSKLVHDFGIHNFTPLRKGLNKTIRWYEKALNAS